MLETVYGFKQGRATKDTKAAYMAMLTTPEFGFDRRLAEAFYENIRNGIVHDTETRRKWVVRLVPQEHIVEQDANDNYVLNRTMFHNALKKNLDNWLRSMREGDEGVRKKMKDRMQQIIGIHFQQ